jgi:DNA polymerase III subunit gamma/tau
LQLPQSPWHFSNDEGGNNTGAAHENHFGFSVFRSSFFLHMSYQVIARKYRPQKFADVVGQEHVTQTLANAITQKRIAHAYLFCGPRGTGKTTIARIFAKCLNCTGGPKVDFDDSDSRVQEITEGRSLDVLEIDGASNNGVEQVRELRQNAGLRPSRARFKIYYIDEVHMLSTGAFNALLKTLEEPPSHVKFFFATTEPNKIPVTVLSRCQRYDFAGITPDQITETLAEICASEKVKADPEALGVIARRAGGSMRDAQSLLEQLLSFGGERLTVELVQQQLGIASDDRTLDLLDALSRRDAAEALKLVDQTASSGVQPTELLGGAFEFLRDIMVVKYNPDLVMLAASPRQKPRLLEIGARWSDDTLLAALQVFEQYRGRLRGSPHGRTIVEIAILRVARLDDLAELGEVVSRLAALESGAPAVPVIEKKKRVAPEPEPTPVFEDRPPPPIVEEAPRGPEGPPSKEWDFAKVAEEWAGWVSALPQELATKLVHLRPSGLPEPGMLVIEPVSGYNWVADACEKADLRGKIESSLRQWLDRPMGFRFLRPVQPQAPPRQGVRSTTASRDGLDDDPIVKLLVERFEARLVRVEVEEDSPSDEA